MDTTSLLHRRRSVKFLSNDYTYPNTNPKTLTTLALALTDPQDTFEFFCFCAPVFCECKFVQNYTCTVDGAVVTSFTYCAEFKIEVHFRRLCDLNLNLFR